MKDALYLEISRKAENLEISLSEGEQTVVHYEECRVPSNDLQNRSGELLHLLNSVSRHGKIPPIIFQELQQIGQVLYNEIFPLRIKKELSDTSAEDLILRIDNRLVQIPWELMYMGGEFFCERFNIGRMVKTQQIISSGARKELHPPFKMLIIADPKGDLQSAYEEGNRIRERFNLKTVSITVVSSEVSIDYLKKKFLQFDLIHYAGHADYNLKDPSSSGWILDDGKFTALDIRKLSGVNPLPPLVFSNACQSGTTEEWQVETSEEEKIYGLANAFLLAGVQHYIGTFWKVLDKPSTSFAIEFYRQLFASQNIGKAMRSARQALKEKYGRENIFWASYLLYGDPTVKYFEPRSAEVAEQDWQFEPQSVTINSLPTNPQWNPEADCLIQEKSQSGVLWKTRSPSELMGKSREAEQQYQRNSQSEARDVTKSCWFRFRYIAVSIGILAIAGVLFSFLNTKYQKSLSRSGLFVNDLVAVKATDKLLTVDWANENSVSGFFLGLLKSYQLQPGKKETADRWTSRPLTIFFNTDKSNEEADTAILIHKIIQNLQYNPRITVLEREQLDIVLQELALASTDLVDSDSALRLGELLSSTLFNTCNLYRLDSGLQVNMRIIENETTVVKAAFSEEWGSTITTDVMADRLSKKIIDAIERYFPLQGKIKAVVDYDNVILNIGARHGLKSGMKFKVIKNNKIYQNGEVISEEDVKVGEIEVNDIKSGYSYSKVLGRSEDLFAGMKVTPIVTPVRN